MICSGEMCSAALKNCQFTRALFCEAHKKERCFRRKMFSLSVAAALKFDFCWKENEKKNIIETLFSKMKKKKHKNR